MLGKTGHFIVFLLCLFLYNIALEEKIEYYKKTGKSLSLYEQKKELVDIKDYDSSWKDVPCKVLQEVIFRLDKSYKSKKQGEIVKAESDKIVKAYEEQNKVGNFFCSPVLFSFF